MPTEMKKERLILSIPTIADNVERLAQCKGKMLNEQQYITYERVYCVVLLGLLNKALDLTLSFYRQVCITTSLEDNIEMIDNVKNQLYTHYGKDQMVLFLTGPAGAGKNTAIKTAEGFCSEFCSSCNRIWTDTSFFYTVSTGSAA